MRALHINDYSENKGGAEAVVASTLHALREQAVDVDCFTVDDVALHRRTPWSYISNGSAARALSKRLESFQPQIVHLHNFYHELSPAILAPIMRFKESGCRVVMTAHDYHLRCADPTLRWFNHDGAHLIDPQSSINWRRYWAGRWDQRGFGYHLLRTCQHFWNYGLRRRHKVIDCLLCPSHFCFDAMSVLGIPSEYLPNPAPSLEKSPEYERADLPTVLFAGRLEPEKGVEQVVSIWPKENQVRLEIIGEGSRRGAIEQLIVQRGLESSVLLRGHLEQSEVMDRMSRVHGVLLPSRCYESAPNVLVEALSRRTPVLVSNLGGMAEFVRETGAGWTFELDDAISLGAGLAEIENVCRLQRSPITDPEPLLLPRSRKAYVSRLIEVYQSLIQPRREMRAVS